MSYPQNIRYKNPDPQDKVNPQGFNSEILNLRTDSAFKTGDGPPTDLKIGEIYLDVLNGDWWRLEGGILTSFYSNNAGQPPQSELIEGSFIEIQQDTPAVGQQTINCTYEFFEGQGITLARPPANDNLITVENSGLVTVSNVGLPAYGDIANKNGLDLEIKKIGSGSNMVLTNDANGVLVATTDTPIFTRVESGGGSLVNPAFNAVSGPRNVGFYLSNVGGFTRNNFVLDGVINAWYNISNYVTEFTSGSNWLNAVSAVTSLGSPVQLFNNIFLQNPPNVVSDERHKHDIQNIMPSMGLDFVKTLRPVSFVYNDTITTTEDGVIHTIPHSRRHLGLIAQEVVNSLDGAGCDTSKCSIANNDFIKDDTKEDKWTLQYEELIPCLIMSIKQLENRIKVLEAYHA